MGTHDPPVRTVEDSTPLIAAINQLSCTLPPPLAPEKRFKSARSYVVVDRTLRVEVLGGGGRSKISAINNFVQELPQKRQIESNIEGPKCQNVKQIQHKDGLYKNHRGFNRTQQVTSSLSIQKHVSAQRPIIRLARILMLEKR
jgi:hypothetical protein